jgi:tetratricopeptide (TPR) repeat protein
MDILGLLIKIKNRTQIKSIVLQLLTLVFLSQLSFAQNPKYKFGDYIDFARKELDKENYTQAIQHLNNAINHRPANYEGYFLRGYAKYALNDFIGSENDFTEAATYDPFNSEIYHFRAIVRSRQYNFGGAIADYNKAIELNPGNPLFFLNRARALLFMNQYDSCLADLSRVIKLNYLHEDVYVLRGMAKTGLEEYTAAIEDFDKAIRKNPEHTNSYIKRGSVWMELKQPDSAIVDFNKAIRINPNDSYAIFNRAIAYMDSEDTARAFRDLNTVIELSPYNSYAYYNRAILKIGGDDAIGAIADLDKVIGLNPDNIAVYLYRGRMKRSTGNYKGAMADYTKAIEIYPEFADAYYERSQLREQMGDFKGAEKDEQLALAINEFNFQRTDSLKLSEEMYLRRLLAFSGKFADKRERDENLNKEVDISLKPIFVSVLYATTIDGVRLYDTYSHNIYGSAFITLLNDNDKINTRLALYELDQQSSGNPSTGEYYLKTAGLYADVQDYNSALGYYNQSIETDQTLILAYFGRANTRLKLIEIMNDDYDMQFLLNPNDKSGITFDPYSKTSQLYTYDQVLDDYNKVIDLDPKFQFVWFNRGNVKCLMGDYWGAVSDYTKAIELDPEFAEAYFNKGLILIFLNLKTTGCQELSMAGELGLNDAYRVLERYCVK